MLNEREMTIARELAKEMSQLNNLGESENEINIMELMELLESLKEAVTNVWSTIKQVINDAVEIIYSRDYGKEHAYNWHVPKDTTVKSQIKLPNIHTKNIRSSI